MLNQNTADAILKSQHYRRPRYSLSATLVLLTGAVLLSISLILPLVVLLKSAFLNDVGHYTGLDNFTAYFSNPALLSSIFNSIWIACVATLITVSLAGVYAFTLCCTPVKGKAFFKTVAFLPILAPSILPSLALVYLFGQQGVLKSFSV